MRYLLLLSVFLLALIQLPAGAAGDKAVLKLSDGSVKTFDSPDEGLSLIVQMVREGKDGKVELTYEGETMRVVMLGDSVETTFGGDTEKTTRAEFLAKMANAKANGQLTSCKSNLKNFATAIEMWAVDHNEVYPTSLGQIAPDYLKVIMPCPAHGRDTYSATYKTTGKTFELNCQPGHPEAGVPAGYPGYNSDKGLVEQP